MCGLYGFVNYKNKLRRLSELTNALAKESAVRGTDAVGVAYNNNNYVKIIKDGKSAKKVTFRHGNEIRALVGHTRHSTQGSEKKNYNNHPFFGTCKNAKFALAHNGVLWNDSKLEKQYKLPKSKVETDSYVAVQLLEYKDKLDFESLKFMAESVEGSFSFSILDNKDNIYLVRGDSPLVIYHFPEVGIYVYASTKEILENALAKTELIEELTACEFEEIDVRCGDILKIAHSGKTKTETFNFKESYYDKNWWDYGSYDSSYMDSYAETPDDTIEYYHDLQMIATYLCYNPLIVDALIEDGFSLEEIEDFLYEPEEYGFDREEVDELIIRRNLV